MRVDPPGDAALDVFLEASRNGDARAGVRVAVGLLDDGASGDDVIVGLLAPSQREVGERWLENEFTVADEHLASGVTQQALDAVASTLDQPTAHGSVVVACAEGDWHSLPAQMFAELLRSHRFDVAFLGASTPVEHAARLMARRRPDALAVSCNLPIFFSGLTRLVDAAHHLGIPVIAGGRAMGTTPARAIRLGADAWASGIDDAVAILRGWGDQPPAVPSAPTSLDRSASELELDANQIATAAFGSLMATYPTMASYGADQLARTAEDLEFIVRFAAATLFVDDPSVFTDFIDWLRRLLAARDVPDAALAAGLSALAPLLDRVDPRAAQLVLDAR